MSLRFCLVLALLACSRKPAPEYGSVCYAEDSYLAQDADGGMLDIADARSGVKLPGFTPKTPKYLTFPRKGGLTVDWQVFDFSFPQGFEYQPGSRKAKVINPRDGGVAAYPVFVEGSPPKSATFGYPSEICSFESLAQTCTVITEEKIVYATYRCREEQL